jgi:hypothetical protein
MNYLQHCNHVVDGEAPIDGCYWCQQLIVDPAVRERRGDGREVAGRVPAWVDEDGPWHD